jgi:ABC-2 type transport system permease protein
MTADMVTSNFKLKTYHFAKTVSSRFVARRSVKGAIVCGIIIGVYTASKSIGFAKLYNTAAARAKIASSFSNNIGLNAILGKPHGVNTVAGYTAWNCVGVIVILLSIWALLLASKTFRGEEDAGRMELIASGQTSLKKATLNTFAGLGLSLFALFVVMAACFVALGHDKIIGFSTGASIYLALTAISIAAIFVAIGALASQLLAPRSRAAGFSAGIFGLFFLLRAMGDITSLSWLLDLTPLGWVEKLQPLYNSQPIWLLPIGLFIAALVGLTIYLAGRRDLGDSILADSDSAKARTSLLNNVSGLGLRLTRLNSLAWAVGLALMAFFYGLITKSAIQAITQSASTHHAFNKILKSSHTTVSLVFLGIIFFIFMLVLMFYAANAVNKLRDEEAQGYLDNILVRPISRYRWLISRVGLILVVITLLALVASFGSYLGTASEHTGIAFHPQLLAGINTIAPAVFTLGVGILALGFIPRLTSYVAYAVVGWSFLIQMLSSGLNLNRIILNTSLLYHVNLAPAVNANWHADLIMALVGVGLGVIGAIGFNRRDLANE